MKIRDQVSTAASNLGRRKVRTMLTSMGVLVGTFTIVIMVSLALGVRRQINDQFESLGLDRLTVRPTTEEGGFNPFSTAERTKIIGDSDLERWKKWPGVTKVSAEVTLPFYVRPGLKWKGKTHSVAIAGGGWFGGRPFAPPPQVLAGTLELPEKGAVVLSQKAAREAGIKPGDYTQAMGEPVELILQASRGESQKYVLRIIGFSTGDAAAVQVSPADRVAMKSWWFNTSDLLKSEGYDLATLRATDVGVATALLPRLKKEGFQVESLEAVMEVANRIFRVITVMLGAVGGIALLVASIGIANTMVMAIYERTREIGTLKAMGASSGEIRQMFMMEAGFIGLLGGVFGLALGWAAGRGLNHAIIWYGQKRQLPLKGDFFVVSPELALGVLAFAALIGVLAGIVPAQRAARLNPLEALRHE